MRGRPSLHLLVPTGTLDLTPNLLGLSKAMIEASLSRLMVATKQVGERMT
jgi:hypothetical protein